MSSQNKYYDTNNNKKSFFLKWWKLVFLAVFIILAAVFIYLFYQQSNNQSSEPEITGVLIKIDNIEKYTPIFLKSEEGQKISVGNDDLANISAGKYDLNLNLSGFKSLAESIEVVEGKTNEFNFNLESESNQSLLPEPQSFSLSSLKEGLNPDKIILPSNTNYTKDLETYAYLVERDVEDSNSQEQLEGAFYTFDELSFEVDLSLVYNQENIEIAKDCFVYQVEFNNNATKLRYFIICAESGRNGFFEYDLETKQETELLTTSEFDNLGRIAINPETNNLAFIKATGEFGFVKDGQVEVVQAESKYFAPSFSPDGKSLLVLESASTSLNPESNLYDNYGANIKSVLWEDFIINKNNASFKDLGKTYVTPKPTNYSLKFWKWLNQANFVVADSPKVFSLSSQIIDFADDKGQEPGRLFSFNNKAYRYYDRILYDDLGEEISDSVSDVFLIKEKLYIVLADRLYTFDNQDKLIQLSPQKPLFIQTSNNNLILINQQLQIQKYAF
jgi:hypothetical protein